MARKNKAYCKRPLQDGIGLGCWEITKLTNILMISGKKTKAESIVLSALKNINPNLEKAKLIFLQAIENVKPFVEIRSRRIGGANYRIPVEVKPIRRTTLALRWIKAASQRRKERTASLRIFSEIVDASNRKGMAMKKKDEICRLAEMNRAFSHFKSQT
ncbi:30S ribosomal subunit protein S7 [Candidatus Tremblaya phenacola PAVE]|nr:30S ribosomal subunit protein S7 [Candidatus Tremblaya phenacola PAVE]